MHVENLEWTTFKGNLNMHTTQVYILKHNQLSSTIQKLWGNLHFSNQTEAGRQLGISQNTINTCCVKKEHTAGGFGFV
jgi:hypothetical protein